MISITDVKTQLNLGVAASGDDQLIANSIDVALAYVAAQTTLSVASSGSGFEEWFNGLQNDITLSVRANDILIDSIVAYDSDGVETAVSAATYAKIGPRTWRFIEWDNDAERIKVVYSSNYAMRAINQILVEVAIWEYLKMPNKTSAFTKTGTTSGETNITFRTDEDFYKAIHGRIGMVVNTW